jgi:hypothetical protein
VVALSSILNISPLYLTGETDEKATCDAADLAKIFTENSGKGKPARVKPVKTKATSDKNTEPKAESKVVPIKKTKKVAEKTAKSVVKGTIPVKLEKPAKIVKAEITKPAPKPKTEKPAAPVKSASETKRPMKIDDASLVKLLEALTIRAKYSDEAAKTYESVKALLVK